MVNEEISLLLNVKSLDYVGKKPELVALKTIREYLFDTFAKDISIGSPFVQRENAWINFHTSRKKMKMIRENFDRKCVSIADLEFIIFIEKLDVYIHRLYISQIKH